MVGLQVSPATVIVPVSLVSVLVIAAGLMFVRLTFFGTLSLGERGLACG